MRRDHTTRRRSSGNTTARRHTVGGTTVQHSRTGAAAERPPWRDVHVAPQGGTVHPTAATEPSARIALSRTPPPQQGRPVMNQDTTAVPYNPNGQYDVANLPPHEEDSASDDDIEEDIFSSEWTTYWNRTLQHSMQRNSGVLGDDGAVPDEEFEEWDYDRLLALDDRVRKRGGLPTALLTQLDVVPFQPDKGPAGMTQEQSCTICLEAMAPRQRVYRLQCSHCFHIECLKGWFKEHKTCPLCRMDLCVEDETPDGGGTTDSSDDTTDTDDNNDDDLRGSASSF